jgi:2-oxoisovalerate dehydrogenase E1 component
MAPGMLDLYVLMQRIRLFEGAAAQLYADGEIPGFVHLSVGQEAVAAGVCGGLRKTDIITSTHRGHGHVIAKGAGIEAMFAELMGRATGTCGGYGGSMHIADPTIGVFGANGIVGAGLPIAVGAALSCRLKADDRAVVAFFGDGAVATGAFHEAVNLAALWRLPVLFCCEANGFSEFSRTEDQHPVPLRARAVGYGLECVEVDGNDVSAVAAAADDLMNRIRSGDGPGLMVAQTARVRGHYEGDPQRYREPVTDADPLMRTRELLLTAGHGEAELDALESAERAEVESAVTAARSAPWPDPSSLTKHLMLPDPPSTMATRSGAAAAASAEPVRISRAIGAALEDALADDDRVFLAGIDVGRGGNVFGITRGLRDRFPGRVLDTPISETAIIGAAVGAAMDGLLPVVELMYLDFLGVCLDQLLNQAAKLRFMTGGATEVGLVVRTQFGVGRSSGSQHSQSLEALLAHIPGLVVVMPSTTEDYYGLLRTAIDTPAPVVFIENRLHYERYGPAPIPGSRVPLGQVRRARKGEDVTVVAISNSVQTALTAADLVASEGISCDVLDLRSVVPLDMEGVLESLGRTNRLLVVTEAVRDFGIGAEILARAAEEGFWSLDAPLRRLGGAPTPVPYSPVLEQAWLPTCDQVAAEIRKLCADR